MSSNEKFNALKTQLQNQFTSHEMFTPIKSNNKNLYLVSVVQKKVILIAYVELQIIDSKYKPDGTQCK